MTELETSEITNEEKVVETVDDLILLAQNYLPAPSLNIVRKAYEFSEKAHAGQIRRSGEPYISHPLGVAAILAELKLDMPTLVAALLHDTVEDTSVTLEEIDKIFGVLISRLVDGVTKISRIKFRNTHEKQGENIRKMIVAMGKDVRVVLVKLADRLHNMRTLSHMPPSKQALIAQETLDIYSPLASRLGINTMKIELEDLSFRYSQPTAYYELAQKVAKKKKEREKYIGDVKKILFAEISKRTQVQVEVQGRPKHLFSIYKKMQTRNISYEQVYDILAFRACVQTVQECYEILGIVHTLWKPIPGRFKDFIAMPKKNNYQSLHTTVIGPGAERIEIQIRTFDMHQVAERGIAAHWAYKESDDDDSDAKDAGDSSQAQKFNWLRDLVAMHQQTNSSDEFLENIKSDLFESEIYVFTPKGEVKEFPDGATPIDFAFSVHTDVGTHLVAARVNGKLVTLKHRLKNGDTVEIMTSKSQQPSKDWLKFCVTTKAKSKIRAHVKAEQRKKALILGRELVEKSLRKIGTSPNRLFTGPEYEKLIKELGCSDQDDLFVKVGFGTVTAQNIIEKLQPQGIPPSLEKENEENFLQKAFKAAVQRTKKTSSLIRVDGMDDVLVRFARCCTPIPGDSIVGYITLGRGIIIHRADCSKAFEMDQGRRIDVEWNTNYPKTSSGRLVRIRVVGEDVPGLLKDMSEVFTSHGVNIHNAQVRTTKDLKAICSFDVLIRDTQQLAEIMTGLSKLKGVIGVTRVAHSTL
ncbi:MAG: bifunctional (p)ppGpp synthetase/guanosine-3',5'-bis(diphosphate) 3'-pyrophosphohydrolase [Bdellovibrionales bacterium]|nr:bifunctional (p)ppGpp synthetase/guanosine-3',5'-bis(diphosphate) 3'-pyrophosphohydrolase [Bdellovibrionales bacterium]